MSDEIATMSGDFRRGGSVFCQISRRGKNCYCRKTISKIACNQLMVQGKYCCGGRVRNG